MKKVSYPVIDSRATGANIKRLMKSKSITPGELGEFMGFVDARAIYKWMEGKSLPSLDNMLALARVLETPIERIIVEDIKVGCPLYDFKEEFLYYEYIFN